MFEKFQAFVRSVRKLRQAASLPDGERAQAVIAARAGLREWSIETLVPRMIQELEDGSPELRRAAISGLRNAGVDAIEAVPALMALFDTMANPKNSEIEDYTRKEAAYAVEEIMRLTRQLIELNERQELERTRAREAEEAKEEARQRGAANRSEYLHTLDELATAAFDEDADVREAALDALGELGGPYDEIVPVVRARLHDEDPEVRKTAAQVLGTLRP